MSADDTSIKISKATRERLSILAEQRGRTMRELVEEFAAQALTDEELAAREQAARAYLSEHMGIEVTAADLAASARLRAQIARRVDAA
ncbi:hypothetical protein [Streptomyces synnematoformans]|uniref:Ribbon-helix-helix protein, CopG family n=1 Tax=Streptomyces synnematoformans TaxID=415721 RepID=A0ABN2XDD8_9ACTN